MSFLVKGISNHTALSGKEAGGAMDHADGSVTDAKLASGAGLADGQILKLPAAVDGQVIGRSGGSWGAVGT